MHGLLFHIFILFIVFGKMKCDEQLKLKVITFADGESDGYWRFMRSAFVNKLDVDVLGVDGVPWNDIDWRLNILRESLWKYKDNSSLVLLYTEAHSTIIQSNETDILKTFKNARADILISSTDKQSNGVNQDIPISSEEGYKYLSSKGVIGYASVMYHMITFTNDNTENDQMYLTYLFVNHTDKFHIKLDRTANLFQILDTSKEHVDLRVYEDEVVVYNSRFKTFPAVISTDDNPTSKTYLNYMGNYVPKSFSFKEGCISCTENTIDLASIEKQNWPTVLISLFISLPTPFVDSYLHQISNLDYPKNKINIFVHNAEEKHDTEVEKWIREFENDYLSLKYVKSGIYTIDQDRRNFGMFYWRKMKTDYYFSVDAYASLTNRKTLQLLIQQNRAILTPLLSKQGDTWSNYWGGITSDGNYQRSEDYLEIVKRNRRGIWNSPHISAAYLLNSSILNSIGIEPFTRGIYKLEPDIDFCANIREKDIFMYVTNMDYYGHMKTMVNYKADSANSDLYQLFDNRLDWENKYIHSDYELYLREDTNVTQPCPDVFWVPVVTKTFTKHLIEECEKFGDWSDGGHDDKRIRGGYEAVPTVDIHMKQIGFDRHWLRMLADYFAPIVKRLFHYDSKNFSMMNFVVKYTTTGQHLLRPHHDASTYTINLALNERHKEYEGGGARFIRYNCSVPDTRVGWALLHPGQLTHYHEGLRITKGTRYIMVSFVDP